MLNVRLLVAVSCHKIKMRFASKVVCTFAVYDTRIVYYKSYLNLLVGQAAAEELTSTAHKLFDEMLP